jgi:hypothetical protein
VDQDDFDGLATGLGGDRVVDLCERDRRDDPLDENLTRSRVGEVECLEGELGTVCSRERRR